MASLLPEGVPANSTTPLLVPSLRKGGAAQLKRVSGDPPMTNASVPNTCRHVNCNFQPKYRNLGELRSRLLRHEQSITVHDDHFRHHSKGCTLCQQLIENGVWSKDGTTNFEGHAQDVCRHEGCDWMTRAVTVWKRSEARIRHERSLNLHMAHARESVPKLGTDACCWTCTQLFEQGVWATDPLRSLVHPQAPVIVPGLDDGEAGVHGARGSGTSSSGASPSPSLSSSGSRKRTKRADSTAGEWNNYGVPSPKRAKGLGGTTQAAPPSLPDPKTGSSGSPMPSSLALRTVSTNQRTAALLTIILRSLAGSGLMAFAPVRKLTFQLVQIAHSFSVEPVTNVHVDLHYVSVITPIVVAAIPEFSTPQLSPLMQSIIETITVIAMDPRADGGDPVSS